MKVDEQDKEILKEIEENFSPANDAIDRDILNEITGKKAAYETIEKNVEKEGGGEQGDGLVLQDISSRSLIAPDSVEEFDTTKKSVLNPNTDLQASVSKSQIIIELQSQETLKRDAL